MTLTDASPLIALINDKDKGHSLCLAVLPRLSGPLLTTWPCFAEAMYLLYRYVGYSAQKALWSYVDDGMLTFHMPEISERKRMQALMEQYRDLPMDLADTSLVAAAEALGITRIFTLDSDFYVYRFNNTGAFEVVP